MSDAPSLPSGDASVATRINELLCLGLLHVKIALLCCVAVTSTEESEMPSEANMVVTRHANCNKSFLFLLKDMGFVFGFVLILYNSACAKPTIIF